MIRQLTVDDRQSFFDLRLEGLKLNPEAFGTGAEVFAKGTDEQIRALLEYASGNDFVLGYFQGEVLTGVIGFHREVKHSVLHKGTAWGFMVLPEFRRHGMGRALLGALIDRVSNQDEIECIRSMVTVNGERAERIFLNQGFKQFGYEPRGIRNGDRVYDQIYLMLLLPRASV
jgi:RimJ/RimL family protein N-acetyltransferase